MTLMRHFLTAHTNKTAQSHRMTSTTPWFWQMLGSTAFICLGLVSDGLACHTPSFNPRALTYYAVQGATNPPNKTITFSRTASGSMTLTASDNATWLTVSPATKSMTTSATLTSAVSTSGRAAGTYNATITLKMGTWCTYTVPVTLAISPAGGGGGGATTSSATLTWNAVTSSPLSGYKVYVGEAPRLYTRTITVGPLSTTTVSSLTVGRMYYFAVAAYNSAGTSPPSNEVSKTIQ
jgi:hypothetical protein